jgi:uncharacterized coiled-coil protein SlyX
MVVKMTDEDTLRRTINQKRLDALTEGLRELVGELIDVITDKSATIASLNAALAQRERAIESLRNQLAEIIPVHERQATADRKLQDFDERLAELDSHG